MLTMDSLQLLVLVIVAEAFTAAATRIGKVRAKVPCAKGITDIRASVEVTL